MLSYIRHIPAWMRKALTALDCKQRGPWSLPPRPLQHRDNNALLLRCLCLSRYPNVSTTSLIVVPEVKYSVTSLLCNTDLTSWALIKRVNLQPICHACQFLELSWHEKHNCFSSDAVTSCVSVSCLKVTCERVRDFPACRKFDSLKPYGTFNRSESEVDVLYRPKCHYFHKWFGFHFVHSPPPKKKVKS